MAWCAEPSPSLKSDFLTKSSPSKLVAVGAVTNWLALGHLCGDLYMVLACGDSWPMAIHR